tara:strand:- start:122 stop:448 length:327 start_codon:yes stop_codon:yes gene_type:complete
MARMKIETLDFEESYDIQRRRKVRMAEIANARQSSIAESESPFSKENMKTSTSKKVQVKGNERKNIQDIGSGTRCLSCGCLHFCWTPKCGACGQSMTFNLGSHSRGGR